MLEKLEWDPGWGWDSGRPCLVLQVPGGLQSWPEPNTVMALKGSKRDVCVQRKEISLEL